ncbi:TonB family protein [Allopontixanthobacter sp.]|uniref:energy transducer TonB n=1 Tax=Allopontixanthobacter sp. TaxID=2906452 RepID=UPI002AB8C6E0|nr:TonB family protein [Allopontixanthobacter sp.]MDZ4307797.1 TonB family protein [Allopontixanthobacter sp.]
MAYVDQAQAKNRKSAVIMVAAIHAVIGYGLIVGLAPGIFDPPAPKPFVGTQIPLPPVPPPPKTDPQPTELTKPVTPPVYTPPSAQDINRNPIEIDTTTVILPPFDPVPWAQGTVGPPKPFASATPPSFDPVAVKPRNDPGAWVTTSDYRSSWINRELTGTAAFKVEVGTNGRAVSCLITRSSGHDALDQATCDLISKRARFEPARNSKGGKVEGTYASSVRWQLPE